MILWANVLFIPVTFCHRYIWYKNVHICWHLFSLPLPAEGALLLSVTTTTGIIIIAVVCCIVGTSIIWVIVIYQTRKLRRRYAPPSSDNTSLPAEIPSTSLNGSSEGTIHQETSSGVSSEGGWWFSFHHSISLLFVFSNDKMGWWNFASNLLLKHSFMGIQGCFWIHTRWCVWLEYLVVKVNLRWSRIWSMVERIECVCLTNRAWWPSG